MYKLYMNNSPDFPSHPLDILRMCARVGVNEIV